MAVGDTLPHCTGDGTNANPYKFTTDEGFLEAIDVAEAYVESGINNLVFNCNNRVIVPTINFKCRSFDGKGLIILNPVIDNTGNSIIVVHGYESAEYSSPEPQILKNLSVFNYVFKVANTTTCLITDDWDSSSGYKRCRFENCHFAGMITGYPKDLGSYGLGTAFIGHNRDNYYMNWVKYEFINCTLNIHFKDSSGQRVFFWLHSGDTTGYRRQSYLYLENCTVSMSGYSDLKINLGNTVGKGTTFESPLNDDENKLECYSFNGSLISKSESGNNLHQLYVETSENITISDVNGNPVGLILTNRYTAGGTKTLTGIVMQETDPTAADYVYNESNLSNEGFPIGEVIH